MASKRSMFIRDRQRNCPSRKRRVKALVTRQQQQAELIADLWSQAREPAPKPAPSRRRKSQKTAG